MLYKPISWAGGARYSLGAEDCRSDVILTDDLTMGHTMAGSGGQS